MRYTLLEMVQQILSSMDSDEVSSYSDTTESIQVANLIKGVYYDIATELGLCEHEGLFELDASGDSTQPTLMTVPSNVVRLDWIKYDNKLTVDTYEEYLSVDYLRFNEFLKKQQSFREYTSGIGTMNFTNNDETFEVIYRNDKMPQWYTTIDDFTLLFDSYDSDEDTTLQKSKTMCYGSVYPEFTLSDSFQPDLDPTQFSYFINRAKTRAFAELKQAANNESAGEARNQKIRIQRVKRRVEARPEHERLPDYGRR